MNPSTLQSISNAAPSDFLIPIIMSTLPVAAARRNLPEATSGILPRLASHLEKTHDPKYKTSTRTYPAMTYAPTTLHLGASTRIMPPSRVSSAASLMAGKRQKHKEQTLPL